MYNSGTLVAELVFLLQYYNVFLIRLCVLHSTVERLTHIKQSINTWWINEWISRRYRGELVEDTEENWVWCYHVGFGWGNTNSYFLGNKNNHLCLLSLMDQETCLLSIVNDQFVYTKANTRLWDLPSFSKPWSLSHFFFASSSAPNCRPACAVNFMAIAYASKKLSCSANVAFVW